MRPDSAKVRAVIARNFAELDNAHMKLTACAALGDHPPTTFLALARQALYNDALSGAIRVYDDHKDAHSLWYVLRCHRKEAEGALAACGTTWVVLEQTSDRLRRIRNRTQFHIDRQSIGDPPETWHKPDIDAAELAAGVRLAAGLLAALARMLDAAAAPLRLSDYDGADAQVSPLSVSSVEPGSPDRSP
ncbi:hypothetical protein IP92_02582 [Pseudoduganella flava]|uniref:HEPN AbiU2-like domain-containing protein n=1 Tax=Pseudoduganella flava TaxID=871742 RepID=A0A562PSU3_9BURK|nr:hypothetical protein [Pseudoduganella flava]QGZ39187.1 hypothetical protein GO485_09105 [Pseudoduganella flava]TWI47522.1 hypothetical protein IP92_02582 [Pseudoduganella flava]